ncbi:hypothetical protein L6R49_09285 [Myxococcota bacterium]|nr:hypothetical protein [Myxococcota bacterium]
MPRVPSCAALVLLTLLGCRRDDEAEGCAARFCLSLDAPGLMITLRRDDTTLLTLPADGLQLGLRDELPDTLSYDPWFEDKDADYVSVVEILPVEGQSGAWRLRFAEDAEATLTIEEVGEGNFALQLTPDAATAARAGYVRLRPRVSAAEGFYGLGELFDRPEHRGARRAMQLELDLALESGYNEAHVPVPLLIGTTGWGLFVEDLHPGVFDVATQEDTLVEVTFGVGVDSADGLRFHLYAADHPLDVTRRYYETTVFPTLPAPWALGPWVWRDESADEAEVRDDLQTLRDLDLATSGYWIDRPYANAVNSFDFDARFPDPEGMISLAHSLGFRMALWHTPYVEEQAGALHQQALDEGWFPPVVPVVFNNWSDPIDFTDPAATSAWQSLIQRYTDIGIEGFKLDYGEDIVPGLNGGRLVWGFEDGSDERTMHREYARLYHKTYAELLPADGGFLLCRAGTWGSQAWTRVIWPGDLDASFARHGEQDTNRDGEVYTAVGGLPAAVSASMSLGPSGFPFFASDTGGYRHSPPDKELFMRWFQHTALTAVMQIGTSTNDVAWESTADNGFDEELLDSYREYTRLHLRLFPMLWSYAQALLQDGRPIVRALGLAYPELGVHPDDTYMLGDHLLVAPVIERGARERALVVPPGRFIHWFDDTIIEGPGELTVPAPLDTLPLYLAEGGVVPLLRPTIDTLSPTDTPETVDSFVEDPGLLYARVFPGPEGEFVLYDGGIITQTATDDGARLSWSPGTVFTQGLVVELLGLDDTPGAVTLDGAALAEATSLTALESGASPGWVAEGGHVWVRLPPSGGVVELGG